MTREARYAWAPITMLFHSVAGGPDKTSVTRSQCSDLIAAAIEWTRGTEGTRPRAVAVTFDDGYYDVLEAAEAIRLQFGLSTTVYVNASLLGKDNRWNPKARERLWHVTATDVQTLCAKGHQVGSHCYRHRSLLPLSTRQRTWELRRGKSALEDAIGHGVRAVAYPYGDYDARILEIAAAIYTTGFGVDAPSPCVPASLLQFCLARYCVVRTDRPESIGCRLGKIFSDHTRSGREPIDTRSAVYGSDKEFF
jgi:peptidoglycan/xylan/chitin deacetylase (PgdA/CDA1 family)